VGRRDGEDEQERREVRRNRGKGKFGAVKPEDFIMKGPLPLSVSLSRAA